MSINPQYTFDKMGNPIGVFLPIEEWNNIADELHLDIPQWQKSLIDSRIAEYRQNPDDTMDWNDLLQELNKEEQTL